MFCVCLYVCVYLSLSIYLYFIPWPRKVYITATIPEIESINSTEETVTLIIFLGRNVLNIVIGRIHFLLPYELCIRDSKKQVKNF